MWVWIPIVSSICGFILLVCVLAIPIAIISKRRSATKKQQQQVMYSGSGTQPVTHNTMPPPPDYANNPPPPDYAGVSVHVVILKGGLFLADAFKQGGTKDPNYSPV